MSLSDAVKNNSGDKHWNYAPTHTFKLQKIIKGWITPLKYCAVFTNFDSIKIQIKCWKRFRYSSFHGHF